MIKDAGCAHKVVAWCVTTWLLAFLWHDSFHPAESVRFELLSSSSGLQSFSSSSRRKVQIPQARLVRVNKPRRNESHTIAMGAPNSVKEGRRKEGPSRHGPPHIAYPLPHQQLQLIKDGWADVCSLCRAESVGSNLLLLLLRKVRFLASHASRSPDTRTEAAGARQVSLSKEGESRHTA